MFHRQQAPSTKSKTQKTKAKQPKQTQANAAKNAPRTRIANQKKEKQSNSQRSIHNMIWQQDKDRQEENENSDKDEEYAHWFVKLTQPTSSLLQ